MLNRLKKMNWRVITGIVGLSLAATVIIAPEASSNAVTSVFLGSGDSNPEVKDPRPFLIVLGGAFILYGLINVIIQRKKSKSGTTSSPQPQYSQKNQYQVNQQPQRQQNLQNQRVAHQRQPQQVQNTANQQQFQQTPNQAPPQNRPQPNSGTPYTNNPRPNQPQKRQPHGQQPHGDPSAGQMQPNKPRPQPVTNNPQTNPHRNTRNPQPTSHASVGGAQQNQVRNTGQHGQTYSNRTGSESNKQSTVPGDDIDSKVFELGLRKKSGNELHDRVFDDERELKKRIREVAVVTLMDERGLTREEAVEAIKEGSWTDDKYSASFLGDNDAPKLPWYRRFIDWLSTEPEYHRKFRKTVETLEDIRGNSESVGNDDLEEGDEEVGEIRGEEANEMDLDLSEEYEPEESDPDSGYKIEGEEYELDQKGGE